MENLTAETLWNLVLAKLPELIGEAATTTWMVPLKPLSLADGRLTLGVANAFGQEFITSRYMVFLGDAIKEITGKDLPVEIKIAETNADAAEPTDPAENSPTPEKYSAPPQTPKLEFILADGSGDSADTIGIIDESQPALFPITPGEKGSKSYNTPPAEKPATAIPVNDFGIIKPGDRASLVKNYTFDTFVIGNSNRMAHAAAKAVADAPGMAYNPFFIYGGVGLGKTHLMHAIGNQILENYPNLRVLYITSEKFTNDFINSIMEGRPEKFRQKYRNVDALLVDDIQFLHKKESTQEEFFHTFNTLYTDKKQIVLSSDRPVSELKTLEDRLKSRFEWGLMADIAAPDLETRIAILKKKSIVEHIEVPNDVLVFIASRIEKNVRELEGALTRVMAYSSLNREKVSTKMAEKALNIYDIKEKQPVTIELIMEVVSNYFKISLDDLIGKSRSRNIVVPRHIAIYLCRELTDTSMPQIGREFGGRDHTSIMHACKKIADDRSQDSKLDNKVNELIDQINRL